MISLRAVLAGLGVQCAGAHCDQVYAHVTHDSRDVELGDLFVARRGETMDGHAFIGGAIAHGASAILAERVVDVDRRLWIVDLRQNVPCLAGAPTAGEVVYILTPNSQQALERIASWWRQQLAVDVIGITGSVGKTTTKETTAAVLSQSFCVLKSERSLNTDVGMALTLLRLAPEHEKAILEMGMYDLGEIAHLCRLARPRIGIVTNVGPTHLERLGSIEAIAQAKTELIDALPQDGVAILNADDARVWAMRERTKAPCLGFGLQPGTDVWASEIVSHGLDGLAFRLHHGQESVVVRTPLIGVHNVRTALAAAAAGIVCGLTLQQIAKGLGLASQKLRLATVMSANGATIIDDSYNASPMSVLAALSVLAELTGRRVAVLGDMLELGGFEREGHRLVGRKAAEVVDLLVVVGERGRLIGEEAVATGMAVDHIRFAASNSEAVALLRQLTLAGDRILVKGSRGMQMEDIVHELALSGR